MLRRFCVSRLQLWGANVHLTAPFGLKQRQLILLGPLLNPRAGDTVSSLSSRFGSSARTIHLLNPLGAFVHLRNERSVPPFQSRWCARKLLHLASSPAKFTDDASSAAPESWEEIAAASHDNPGRFALCILPKMCSEHNGRVIAGVRSEG